MTRDQFVQAHRHELYGMVLEMFARHEGPEASVRLRFAAERIDRLLGQMYDEVAESAFRNLKAQTTQPGSTPNGRPTQPVPSQPAGQGQRPGGKPGV